MQRPPIRQPAAPPRPVALLRQAPDLVLWLFLSLVAIVAGGGITAAAAPYAYDNIVLDQHGVEAEGEVVGISAYQQRSSIFHKIDVRFRDREGDAHRAVLRTQDRALIARAEAKKSFTVVYDPNHPSRNRFSKDIQLHWSVAVTPLPIAIGGFIALGMGVRRTQRRTRLLRHGSVAQGIVTSIDGRDVLYQFVTPLGPMQAYWSTRTTPAVGAPLWVIYDPQQPSSSIVWR